jgi:broad specificity phosphatase PhoE
MSQPQRLFLARHGHTGWNDTGRYLGSSDIPLDAQGQAQAERLGEWAASARLEAIVSSPALRAFRTAAIVAAGSGLTPRTDARLRELDFGAAEGRTLEELRRQDPEAVTRFELDPVSHHLPGGEHPQAAVARLDAAIRDVLSTGTARALLVTHNTVLRLFVCHCLGIPLAHYRRLLPLAEHCALTELSVADGAFALRRFNAVPWRTKPPVASPAKPAVDAREIP